MPSPHCASLQQAAPESPMTCVQPPPQQMSPSTQHTASLPLPQRTLGLLHAAASAPSIRVNPAAASAAPPSTLSILRRDCPPPSARVKSSNRLLSIAGILLDHRRTSGVPTVAVAPRVR